MPSGEHFQRVQVVVSGKFIALLVAGLTLCGVGWYYYKEQHRPRFPLYYVNRQPTIIKSCRGCLLKSQLREPQSWKFGRAEEIPAGQTRWFLPVQQPPVPVNLDGVMMLPVHPAFNDNPLYGFDRTKVLFVTYQDLEGKFFVEPPRPPSTAPLPSPFEPLPQTATAPVETIPVTPNPSVPEDPPPATVLPEPSRPTWEPPHPVGPIIELVGDHQWRVTLTNSEWFDTGIPIVALQHLDIKPTQRRVYAASDGRWEALIGTQTLRSPMVNNPYHELSFENLFSPAYLPPHEWLVTLRLRMAQARQPEFTLDVRTHLVGWKSPWDRALFDEIQHAHNRAEQMVANMKAGGGR